MNDKRDFSPILVSIILIICGLLSPSDGVESAIQTSKLTLLTRTCAIILVASILMFARRSYLNYKQNGNNSINIKEQR